MKVNDALIGAFLVLFAGAIFLLTRDFPPMPGQPYSGALFPRVIATCFALAGGWLVLKRVWDRGREPWVKLAAWTGSAYHVASFALIVGGLVFYILVSDTLGFIITAFILLMVLFLWLRGPRTIVSSLAISAVSVLVIHQFFSNLLRVPLPWGILQDVVF